MRQRPKNKVCCSEINCSGSPKPTRPLIKLENYLHSYIPFLKNQVDSVAKAKLQTIDGLDLLCFKEGLC